MNQKRLSFILVGIFVLIGIFVLNYNNILGLSLISCAIGLLIGIGIFNTVGSEK